MNHKRTYSDRPVPMFLEIGERLHIHFNEEHHQKYDDGGASYDVYSYNEVVCNRNEIDYIVMSMIVAAGGTREQAMEIINNLNNYGI